MINSEPTAVTLGAPAGASALALRQARRTLLEQGRLPETQAIDALVARSWQRSWRAGLPPLGRLPEGLHLDRSELVHELERQRVLLAHARPVMEYLYGQTRDTDSMVILADAHGLLLQTMGDPTFLGRAERVALSAGASWHERYRGTNAIGTALAEASPVVINGPEHYLERNGFLTCAAAPVAAPDGHLLGVLDISGDHRRHHPHTFCLVRSAAQMIENGLFKALHGHHLQLRFHSLAEGIGTLAEGVLAIREDGVVVGANRAALGLLDLHPTELGQLPLDAIFQISHSDVQRISEQRGREVIPLALHNGQKLFARPEQNQKAGLTATPPTAKTKDALAALDTGCRRVREALDKARKITGKAIPVLLQGESGVGKEVFAKAMHATSGPQPGPFVAVDCSSLPENLIEAELFGYSAGAFTGARKSGSIGRIREAAGGTLFLDEIGDMPLAMQSRLLRVLQEREVVPLGGGKPHPVSFNLICATHRDLKTEMQSGRFRADLYYRINGLTLLLPALRERSDLSALIDRLLKEMAPGVGLSVASDVLEAFARYPWPGNIRELHNVLRTACALRDSQAWTLSWAHLPDDLLVALHQPTTEIAPFNPPATENLRQLSLAAIHKAIELTQGNMSAAARRLGISRNTLYRRLQQSPQ